MGIPQAMDFLKERAALVKESLHRSQTITDSMVAILGSFDHRLSALETAMRPTQVHFSLPLFSMEAFYAMLIINSSLPGTKQCSEMFTLLCCKAIGGALMNYYSSLVCWSLFFTFLEPRWSSWRFEWDEEWFRVLRSLSLSLIYLDIWQIKTHSIRRAHENIDKALKIVELILGHFEQNRKVKLCFWSYLFLIRIYPQVRPLF